ETSNASATTSPFRPSTQTPANSSHQPPDNNPPGAGGADAPPAAAASPAKVSFSDQSLRGASSPGFMRVRAAAQIACAYSGEPRRTAVNCNPDCNPGFGYRSSMIPSMRPTGGEVLVVVGPVTVRRQLVGGVHGGQRC